MEPLGLLLGSYMPSLAGLYVCAAVIGTGINMAWNPAMGIVALYFMRNRALAYSVPHKRAANLKCRTVRPRCAVTVDIVHSSQLGTK